MAISLTPLRTSCKSVLGETIFEDGEFEKQIRKKYSWWLPVALPCRLRDSSPLTDHSISGKLSSDVALWLVELRHASDSDDLLTGLKLRVECENTSTDKWNFGRGKCRDSVELETTDERDSDTIGGDLYVLSGQQIVGPDLSSADVIVDDKGVVLDQVNHNSTEIIPLIAPHIERTECDEDISYRSKELDSTVSAFHLGEEIDGIAGGGVHQSWTANPCYTAVTVGGVKWQCRGDCYREREARFRKLCQSVLEEVGRTLSNELAAFCPQDSEVECLKYSVFESDKIPGSNISDKQAHYSLKTEDKSTAPSFASRSNSESTDSDISVVLLVKSELFMNELKTTDDGTSTVCVNEPSCRALFTASDNNRDLGSALHSLSEGSNQCSTANPVNNKCDDVLRDLENIMHCLQGMEDSYASRNSEFVECQENQDVEFLLLCNNADHLITETLQCYKSQWIPNRKEKPVSETNSNISDDVFLSPVSKSDETDVFLNDTPALEVKEHYNFNINDIFDDGTKPPIPPLRRKKREKSNSVAECSLGQAMSLGLKTRHESETVNLHDCHKVCTSTPEKKPVVGVPDDGETLLADSQYNLLFTESTTEKDKACSYDKYPDLCSAKQLIDMSSTENIIVPNKSDLSSDSNVSITCGEPPATTILENDSYSHSSVLEVAVPQAIPVSSFEFPPCSARKGEVDEISNSVEICGKQRIRPVVSLQDFASNIYEDIYPSYSSLDRSRKGSGSSDIAAWKNELQRSGFFSQGDDCLQSDEWFSSTDHEGRVYFFEENSVESSWTLPKVTVDDSEVSVKKSVLDAPVDPLLRVKEGEKRSTTRMTKARSLLVTDKKQRESSNRSSSIPKNFLLDQSAVLKEGPLNRTKITENGKKVRKNWAVGHVILREQFLVFYKDSKSVQPELVMELSELVLESGDKMSKRKNVFLVSTAGLQVLCQAEDTHLACDWCLAIKQALDSLDKNSKNSTKLLTPHSPGEENRCSSLVRSRSLRSKSHEGSTEDQLSNYEEQTKIRNRLKRFFHRRPTRETLARKGIYKDEPVFDNHLEKVCSLEHPRIPKFVQLCINAIEGKEENMKTDGLYRASGNLSHVQKIRLEVDQNNLQVLEREDDVHVLTGALKLFFRELKEPLIPFELFTTALETVNSDKKKKIRMFQEIVQQLPDPNRDTLAFLLRHLRKVTEYEEHNRMHIPNLAIVFGPTLIWREKECHQNMALEYMQQNLVIEFFLLQYDEIFKNFKLPDS